MPSYLDLLNKIKRAPRYIEGITYGKPRKGHLEGTVENHIIELEQNLERIASAVPSIITCDEYWKLLILIHVHDAFKLEGKRLTKHQVSLRDPQSHASLARKFLSEFTDDQDMLNIIQFHDEGFALWQQIEKGGKYDQKRMVSHLEKISNKDMYLIFTIIDSYTAGKLQDRTPRWFVDEVNKHAQTIRAYQALEVFGV